MGGNLGCSSRRDGPGRAKVDDDYGACCIARRGFDLLYDTLQCRVLEHKKGAGNPDPSRRGPAETPGTGLLPRQVKRGCVDGRQPPR